MPALLFVLRRLASTGHVVVALQVLALAVAAAALAGVLGFAVTFIWSATIRPFPSFSTALAEAIGMAREVFLLSAAVLAFVAVVASFLLGTP